MALFYPDILKHNNSNYAIIDNTEVRGGAQSVTDKATRNLIPLDKRTLAMLVSYKDGAANVTKRFDGLTTANVDWTSDANWSDVVPIGINYATANNAFTGNNSFAGNSIFNGPTTFNSSITVPSPTLLTQAVNKQYVDDELTTSLAELSDSIDSLVLHKAGNETKSGILTIDSLSAGTSGLVLSKLPNVYQSTDYSTGFINPYGLVVLPNGDALVTNPGTNTVLRVPSGGGTAVAYGTGVSNPSGIALLPNGDLLVCNLDTNTISRIPSGGGTAVTYSTVSNSPLAIAILPNGEALVVINNSTTVVKIPSGGGTPVIYGTGFAIPKGIAILPNGDALVTESNNGGKVLMIPSGGGAAVTYSAGFHLPNGIVVLPNGEALVTDTVNSKILRIPSGGGAAVAYSTGVIRPYGIALLPNGDLLVTDIITGKVSKLVKYNRLLTTDGSGVVVKSNYLEDVQYVKSTEVGNIVQAQLNGTGFVKMTGTSPSYITDNSVNWNTAYGWGNHAASGYFLDANKSSIALGGELSGTTGVATLVNSAVTGKLLTGLSISGSGISATDSILSAFGKLQNQVAGLVGGSQFQSVWDASTNLPALVTGVGTKGYYYIVDVAGTTTLDGINEWAVGDWAIFDGTKWRKVDNTDAISSFNGSLGSIVYTPSGVTNRISITGAAGLAPVIDISANYAGQGTITTLGTITTGTWNSNLISPTYGGTGINNGIKTITLGGNLVTIGAFNTTVRTTAATDVTLPVSGTLVGSSDIGTVTNVMLAGSIADSKLSTITTAGKVSTTALTGTLATLGTTAVTAGSTVVTLTGLTSVTSSSFVGDLTGNASTATKVNTAVTFNSSGAGAASGSTFDGSAARAISYNTIGAQEAISSTNYICGVAIPGVPDGVLRVFTLSSTPLPGTEMIFMNGVLMQRGTDYTIAGDVVTFSIGQEPEAGTNLTATYFV